MEERQTTGRPLSEGHLGPREIDLDPPSNWCSWVALVCGIAAVALTRERQIVGAIPALAALVLCPIAYGRKEARRDIGLFGALLAVAAAAYCSVAFMGAAGTGNWMWPKD